PGAVGTGGGGGSAPAPGHGAADGRRVEVEAMAGVPLDGLPLLLLVTAGGPPRDVAELAEIILEEAEDRGGAPCHVSRLAPAHRPAERPGGGRPPRPWAPRARPGTLP